MKLAKRLFLMAKLKAIDLQIWNLTQQAQGTDLHAEKLNELILIYDSLYEYLNG